MKKVRLAIIGCGGFVHYHVRSIVDHVKGFKLVGLVDTVRKHAERIADNYPIGKDVPIYKDYQRMLKELQPEAVIVSTPHTLRTTRGSSSGAPRRRSASSRSPSRAPTPTPSRTRGSC